MQGSREGKVRLSTHTFAGMANALTRKEPPHDDQPELMTRAERRRAARKARAAKTWKKVAAGTVAVATLFGGDRLRAGRGKGGAKERPLRGLKEKVTSPFPPSLRLWK